MGWPTQTSTNLVIWFLNVVVWPQFDYKKACIDYKEVFFWFVSNHRCFNNAIALVHIPDLCKATSKNKHFHNTLVFPGTSDMCEINATFIYPEHLTHIDNRLHFRKSHSPNCTLFCNVQSLLKHANACFIIIKACKCILTMMHIHLSLPLSSSHCVLYCIELLSLHFLVEFSVKFNGLRIMHLLKSGSAAKPPYEFNIFSCL